MARQMTINEANARIVELKKEIQWLEPLVDQKLAQDLELHIDEAPPELAEVLNSELDKRKKELDRMTKAVERYMRDTPFDFDMDIEDEKPVAEEWLK